MSVVDEATDFFCDLESTAAGWAILHRKLRGSNYSFKSEIYPQKHRPFLVMPLIDGSKIKCFKKSRQAGVSENSITEALYLLSQHEMKAVYTFPSPKQVEDFSNTRVKPALEESEYMRSLIGEPDNVKLRKIGKGYLFLRAGTNPNFGEGIDADAAFFDEIDRMPDRIKIAFQESLSSSPFGLTREISTPTLPGRGVDLTWEKSKQYRWFVECLACGHKQVLQWPDNIRPIKEEVPIYEKVIPRGSYTFCCEKCGSDKINRRGGEWVPAYPAREIAGYHINQLQCVWISADEIVQKYRNYRFPQLFWNYVLGETFAEGGRLLTEAIISKCWDTTLKHMGVKTSRYSKTVVGIDWGDLNWAVVLGLPAAGGNWELLDLICTKDNKEPLGSTKEIEKAIRPYNPDCIVADLGYGKDRVTYLQAQFPHRVFGCTYAENSTVIMPRFSDTAGTVAVDRTAWLKSMANTVRERQFVLWTPDKHPLTMTFIQHLCSLTVLLEEEDTGEIIEKVDHVGDDHFAHAFGYAQMACAGIGTGSGFKFGFA